MTTPFICNKFEITNIEYNKISLKDTHPVLFKVSFGNSGVYYIHKGKRLKEAVTHFLNDVFRGMRGMSCFDYFQQVASYCKSHPQVNKVTIEVLCNDTPDKILKKEILELKKGAKDPLCLNIPGKEPYKPEWMLKEIRQSRCEKCLISAKIDGKTVKFNFCPNCGRIIKQLSSSKKPQ